MEDYIDNQLSAYCGSPKLTQWGYAGFYDRRNLNVEEAFERDVMQLPEQDVGGDDDDKCENETCEGNIWYYPGWEASIAFTAFFHDFGFGVGYAGTLDSVVFSYFFWAMGYETEAL